MNPTSKNIPMSSAPFVYDEQGNIAWDKMWDAFCVLAKEGGPPHRGILLEHKKQNDITSLQYKNACQEILRAYKLLVPYSTEITPDSWVKVSLYTSNMAKWFAEIINSENVKCNQEGRNIYLPVNDDFTTNEIKNVVTVIAKAFHYWKLHRSWFAKFIIHISGQDWEEGVWK